MNPLSYQEYEKKMAVYAKKMMETPIIHTELTEVPKGYHAYIFERALVVAAMWA